MKKYLGSILTFAGLLAALGGGVGSAYIANDQNLEGIRFAVVITIGLLVTGATAMVCFGFAKRIYQKTPA